MAAEVVHQWAPALARPCQQDHQCPRLVAPTPQHPSVSSSETSIPGTPVRTPVPASSTAPKRKLDANAADGMRPRTRQRGGSSSRSGGGTCSSGSSSTGGAGGAFVALLAVAALEQQLEEARRARATAHR